MSDFYYVAVLARDGKLAETALKNNGLARGNHAGLCGAFCVVANSPEEAAALLKQPVVCLSCGGEGQVTHVSMTGVPIVPADLREDGFLVEFPDGAPNFGTEEETVRCMNCQQAASINYYSFQMAQEDAPVIALIGGERADYPSLSAARAAFTVKP